MSSASPASPATQSQPQSLPQTRSLTQPHVYPPISNVGTPVSYHGNGMQTDQKFDLLGILSETPPVNSISRAPEDWTLDIELMHHYCTVTCDTLTVREDARYVWRVIMPIEGYASPYVMNGLLAIGALHRAYLATNSQQKERYVKASAYHITTGLQAFREIIALPLNSKNWQPVFCFASMINVHLMGTPIRLGVTRWPAPISNVLDLFGNVKGLQVLMAPFIHSVRKSQLAALVNSVWLVDPEIIPRYASESVYELGKLGRNTNLHVCISPAQLSQSLLPLDFWPQVSQLRVFIDNYPFAPVEAQPGQTNGDSGTASDPPDRRKEYIIAIEALERAARSLELAGTRVEWGMMFLFAHPLTKIFHDDLQAHEPAALVILAYWCALIHLVDDIWVTNGLSWQLLQDVESKIRPEFQEWLTWPKHWVFERRGYSFYMNKA
ncbi:hypothetical protein N7466_010868 [Penicillium verhagenii]|uniref:uncharacterized protein n=1 Tax=Penicillium verhagenii TaxID=1562060 RepID=UPI002545BB14|nr:uncharacterized protein N7466_010868 [Penicillium verhagenii]KAJ5917314.1 hypothetical protein N7466_010868 [Penicillium verhagenii]